MPKYDWRKTLASAGKAGAFAAISVVVYDPSLVPFLVGVIPPKYAAFAILLPAIIGGIKNWLQNMNKGT